MGVVSKERVMGVVEELREEEGDGRGFEGSSGNFEADKGLRRRSSSEARVRMEEYLLGLMG